MQSSADSRTILKDELRRCLSGQPAAEISELLLHPAHLSQIEKSAWLQLHDWSSERQLWQGSTAHAYYSRNRLTHLLSAL